MAVGQRTLALVFPEYTGLVKRCSISGQITSDFQKSCQALKSKIFRFTRRANQCQIRPSHPMRGADRDRHERAVGCGGRASLRRRAQAERTAKPCGPDAPTLASSSREARLPAGDGGNKARSPGRARYKPVETTAQGKPGCLRWTCMLVCVFLCNFAHETAGAARTRLSLRPLPFEGGNRRKARAHARRENATACCSLNSHRPRKRTIQYSRDGDAGIDRHGVLDSRTRGDDDALQWSGNCSHATLLVGHVDLLLIYPRLIVIRSALILV